MNKAKLDQEERDLLDEFESGNFTSTLTEKRKSEIQTPAEDTFKKDKRINIRLSGHDLSAIQRRALEEGIPYQTLVASVLHKYVSGTLHDITANKFSKRTR
jgi:predicted DNA binding CopG/RHH family protein